MNVNSVYHSLPYINSEYASLAFNNDYAVIGVSPFNSYFTEGKLIKLFGWALANFKDIKVFIPDEISAFTLQAIGYDEIKAKRKTRKQDNYLKNKVIKALIINNIPSTAINSKLVLLSDLLKNKEYIKIYAECLNLFNHNNIFRKGCLETSEWVLSSKNLNKDLTEESMCIAVKYFLAELPLFVNTAKILNLTSAVFIYKDIPAYLKLMYQKQILVSINQKFLVVNY